MMCHILDVFVDITSFYARSHLSWTEYCRCLLELLHAPKVTNKPVACAEKDVSYSGVLVCIISLRSCEGVKLVIESAENT